GHEGLPGLMVAGLSTRLPMNEAYGTFHELLATTVGHVAASALADEAKRRQAEALAEINQAKTDFFANISHEFRTPLTLMLGPLEDELGEQTSPLSAPRRERLATAHRNSMRLLKLVNSLLDFSRLEAGRAQASYQPTDLAALTTELAGMFRSAIEKARLTLVVDCPGLPEPVFVDREMWEKIVLNLVSNAFKHTFTGGIRVSLRWRGDHIELAVADSGVGIPADNVPHLFERFHRVKGARSRTHEGTGIGLALVHELIQLHGGTVRVESVPGQGSTFIATLKPGRAHLPDAHIVAAMPLEPSTRTAAYVEESLQWVPVVPAPSAGAVAAADADRARIVWADDNADMREYVHRLLGEFYTVTAVSNGTEAVAVSLAAPPDLVLTDIMMPGLDGFGVLRELRADVRTRHVPVILLSARAGEEAAVGGLKAGADDYLIKPFAARELLARVRTHLGLAKLRREWAAEQERTAELVRSEAEGRKLLETAEESRRALLGILEDQQRAEAAQQVSRETLRLMLDAAHIGYWDLDLVTHAAARSLRHDQIFGYEELQADWTYEKFLAHVHPEERERANRLFHAGVAAKTEWDFECRILRRDGTLCWVWVHGNVFTNAADEAVRMLGMVNDITKRKQAEEEIHRLNTGLEQRVAERTAQLEAANKELEAFSYSVSHDLRAPLRAVDGFSQAVLEDHGPQLPAEGQRQLQTIRQSAQQMGALINDLLAFSRLSRQELKKRPVDTGRLVHECLGELKLQQEGRRIETKVGELPPCSGDRALLKQVFLNLISNALKYSRKRDPAVIEIGCRQEKGLETYFVRDNGTGFDMRYAPKLFGVFQRLHRAEDYEGTGVGLAIVQRIVHRHGGRVWAEAAPDLGARFFFTLQEEAKS
ncbi:MAG TPA: ATP-binding protein, partial [Lacunisphaera sp.]|nr:ATP-binding protein [Lacunisphaera sp.]